MVRYLRFRLGLAILFYAAFICTQNKLVHGQNLKTTNQTRNNLNDEYVFYQGVQGKPGVDFPVLSHIPKTSFNCRSVESGYYADLETDCQVFHICEDNKKISFLCPNGTIFQQSELICEWWFKVNCTNSPNLYEESAEQLREDNARRKSSRRVNSNNNNNNNNNENVHGAVMRMEEQSSVSASQNGRHVAVVQHNKVGSKRVHADQNQIASNYATNEKKYNNNNNNRHQQHEQKQNDRITLQVSNIPVTTTTTRSNKKHQQQKYVKEAKIQDSGDELVQFNAVTPRVHVQSTSTPYQNHFKETFRQAQVNNDYRKQSNAIPSTTQTPTTSNNFYNYEINSTPSPSYSFYTNNNNFNYAETTTTQKYASELDDLNKNSRFTTTYSPSDIQINFNQITSTQRAPVVSTKAEKLKNSRKGTSSRTRNDLLRRLEPTESEESQVPQETAGFYKSSFNQIDSSQKPGTTAVPPNHRETYTEIKEPKYYSTKIYSAISSVTPQYLTTQPLNNGRPFVGSQVGKFATTTTTSTQRPRTNQLFNVGQTEKPLPTVTRTTTRAPSSYSTPGLFNLGSTPTAPTKTARITFTTTLPPVSTTRKVDHATVYGRFAAEQQTTATPQEILKTSHSFNTLPAKYFGKEPSAKKVGTNFNTNSISSTTTLAPPSFYITKKPEAIPLSTAFSVDKEEVQKPRPFQLPPTPSDKKYFGSSPNLISPTVPNYKISSASPFTLAPTTEPTPLSTETPSTFENIDSMINALAKMANEQDYASETPRPGLVIPPSAGPQTLHTLAVYFANALDAIGKDDAEEGRDESDLTERQAEKKRLTALLTKMTMNRYNELFIGDETTTLPPNRSSEEDLEAQNSKAPVQNPKVRQLAKVFTQALSSYLDDPATFRRVLEEVRPTEPPLVRTTEESDPENDELLNFSDADSKSSYPPIFPTLPSVRPTWGYLIAYNTSSLQNNFDGKNSLNADQENFQVADSQSFISQLNKLNQDTSNRNKVEPVTESDRQLIPNDHWTTSPNAHKLWKSAFSFDPASINENFDGTTELTPITSTTQEPEDSTDEPFQIKVQEPEEREIQYELRALPKIALNSTQVHGILIDFMNTTAKQDEDDRLHRILRKLNTTQDEFLEKMREIEGNPLTRRLILLLISECGTNATKQIQTEALPINSLLSRSTEENKKRDVSKEILETASTGAAVANSNAVGNNENSIRKAQSSLKDLVDQSLHEDSQDARALQLLNSLYSIASKFGK